MSPGKRPFLAILTLVFFLGHNALAFDPEAYKESIIKELEKIREEYNPRVKIQRLWVKRYDEARVLKEEALSESAEVYARDKLDQGDYLMGLSMEYAKKRQYRKAEYLARKARAAFTDAKKEAISQREREIEGRRKELAALKKKISILPRAIAPGARDELELKLIILKSALQSEDLQGFDQVAQEINATLRAFSRAHQTSTTNSPPR